MTDWINIANKLPEGGVDVLTWLPLNGWCEIAFYTSAGEWFAETGVCKPSHWMPLPEGPGGKP